MKYLAVLLLLFLFVPLLLAQPARYEYVCPVSLHLSEPRVLTEVQVVSTVDTPSEIDCRFRNIRGEDVALFSTTLAPYASEQIRPDICRNRSDSSTPCDSRSGSIFLSSTQPVSAAALIYVQDVLAGIVKFDPLPSPVPKAPASERSSRR